MELIGCLHWFCKWMCLIFCQQSSFSSLTWGMKPSYQNFIYDLWNAMVSYTKHESMRTPPPTHTHTHNSLNTAT
jgi:hypothetical protein